MNKEYLGFNDGESEFNIQPEITRGAWNKIIAFGNLPIQLFREPLESKRFLLVKRDNPNLIKDVYYPKQRVSGGDVTADGSEIFNVVEECSPRGLFLRGWEHVHPYFGTMPSSTDKDNNEMILTQIPLELRVIETIPVSSFFKEKNIEIGINLYTSYLISIIHNPTVKNPGLIGFIENVSKSVDSLLPKIPGEEKVQDYLEPYVEVAFRRWTDFFVPREYVCHPIRLKIVDVEDDIPFQPDIWKKEVKAKTTPPRRRIYPIYPGGQSHEQI